MSEPRVLITEADDGGRIVSHFDERGNEIRVEDFDSDGRLEGVIERAYNDRDQCLGWNYRLGDGKLMSRFELVFDASGTPSKLNEYDGGGLLVDEHEVDEDGDPLDDDA